MNYKQMMPDLIATQVREMIIQGDLLPGDRLKQKDLAERFNTSLIPVREALRLLETESFVRIYPNRGAVVSVLSKSDLMQLFEARVIIESAALRLSVEKLDQLDLHKMRQFNEKMKSSEGHQVSLNNRDFHKVMYSRCDNQYLLDMVYSHFTQTDRYLNIYLNNRKHNRQSVSDHKKIIRAIAKRDFDHVEQLLITHITDTMYALTALI